MADALVAEKTVEIQDPPAAAEKPAAPTRAELEAQGWTAEEIGRAETKGLLPKPEEKKAPEAKKPEEPKPEAKEPEKKPAAAPRGALPDFTMTPEQERVFLETFGAGTQPRAMYFRMKNERSTRQASEARVRELEAQVSTLKALPATEKPAGEEGEDPEDRPLTLKDLKALQAQEAEAYKRREREQGELASKVSTAQATQEEYVRSIYPDFDAALAQAKDLMLNLETLVPEKHRQAKVLHLIRQLQVTNANADKLDLDEYHAAHIAYEIGQLHPEYGKAKAEPKAETPKSEAQKGNGNLTPEQMRRAQEVAAKRPSSASLSSGGGKRTIAVEDVDLAALNAMDAKARLRFREQHPEQYNKLLRS